MDRKRIMSVALSAIAIFGCSACSIVDGGYSSLSVPVTSYEVPAASRTYAAPAPISAVPASYPSFSLQAPMDGGESGILLHALPEISQGTVAGSGQLYSSEALLEVAAERQRQALGSVPRDVRSLSAQWSLSAPSERTGLGFDVNVVPRASYTRNGALATRSFGGEVRIGQNFDRRGEGDAINGWSLFIGADGEALVWEPENRTSSSTEGMALRDRVTVGDMQAGIAFQTGPGQISLSYIRREVEYHERNLGASENEEFAGITFTIRR